MNLDIQQQAAVETTSNRALVLAGAGSGKTRVLIERIAWLIETQKVSPTEIMTFSFTRKASGEIRDRLFERIGTKAYGCILARKHALLGKIDRLMEEVGILHTYVGKTTALTNSESFRRFHAFLKLAVNPYDNFSFLLIRDIIGLSREEYGQIRLEAADKGRSHFQVFEGNTNYLSFQSVYGDSLSQCVDYMNSQFPDLSPESVAFIGKWWGSDHVDDIASYLDWLAMFDVQDEIKREADEGIILATIHAAKGLEWPLVIIAGCNEGIIPGRPNDPDEIEAERRLMYVAMTRAMDQLIITIRPTESTDAAGRPKKSLESRFINEMKG